MKKFALFTTLFLTFALGSVLAQNAGLQKDLEAVYAKVVKSIQNKDFKAFIDAKAPPKAGAQPITEKQFNDYLPQLAKMYAPLDPPSFLTVKEGADQAASYYLVGTDPKTTTVRQIVFLKVKGVWKLGDGTMSSAKAEPDKKAQALKMVDNDKALQLKK